MTHNTTVIALIIAFVAMAGLAIEGIVIARQEVASEQPQPVKSAGPSGRQMKMDHLEKALKVVEEATKAVEDDEKTMALAKLKEAKELITTVHACLDGPKVVNAHCPVMGTKLNPATVPEDLMRMYKEQKVGFCCAGCPEAWDKLTDQEKDAKLAGAGKALRCGCVDRCCCWK